MSTTRSSGPVAGRKLTKTKHEGIYARGSTYVVRYRTPDGKQRQQACRTVDEAKLAQAEYASHKQDGSYREPSRLTVNEYAAEWLASYTGRTARGIRPETLKGYGAQLRVHVLPTLGRKRLTALGPRDVKQLATELRGKGLATNSVRLALAPLKAMLACAYEDELIKANPALNVRLATPQTDAGGAVEVKVKALSPDELSRLLAEIPAQWRLLPELLAVSGLRIGEALALDWASVDFGRGRVLVRRRWYRGTFAPPKSRYGRRDVPITPAMTQRLWARRKDVRGADDALIFGSAAGTPLNVANFYNRVYSPAAKRAGVPWATLHSLRHTCATNLFREGKNAKQVQGWLGHHAASFTLDTYIHALEDDLGDAPASFDAFQPSEGQGVNRGSTDGAETGRTAELEDGAKLAQLSQKAS